MTRVAGSQWRQGQTFLAAMLLALASALVPALFPFGAASTRIAGSAFDPTTSAVALRSRAQAIVHAAAIENQDKAPTTSIVPLLSVRMPQETPYVRARHHPAPAIVTQAPRLETRHITRAQPRAPPHPIA